MDGMIEVNMDGREGGARLEGLSYKEKYEMEGVWEGRHFTCEWSIL